MRDAGRDGALLVEEWRGGAVENLHDVVAAVCGSDGRLHRAWGNPSRTVFPRSAIKPFAAVALTASGAADALGIDAAELALASGSHFAEPRHLQVLGGWIARLGIPVAAIECGPLAPLHSGVREALRRSGAGYGPLHNNSAGRHLALLSMARHLGVAPAGYRRCDHPVQRLVNEVLESHFGIAVDESRLAVERCGLPAFPLAVATLARAAAILADGDARDVAAVRDALLTESFLAGGTTALSSRIVSLGAGRLLVKGGSDGVYVAACRGTGVGLAMKALDGSQMAADVALLELVRWLGWLPDEAMAHFGAQRTPAVFSTHGEQVGHVACRLP
jgi:L-asparaginase II